MQNNANHRYPAQPVQAPPALLGNVLARLQQAEQAAQEDAQIATAFASPDWTRRAALCERLAHAERTQALPWLQRALSDSHPTVRALAVHALGQQRATELLPPLLSDANWQVREAARLALGQGSVGGWPDLASENAALVGDKSVQDSTPGYPLSSMLSEGNIPMKSMHHSSSRSFEPSTQAREWQESAAYSLAPGQQHGKITQSARRFPRLLGLVAAILVCAVLVGSMALVFSVTKGNSGIPGTGNPGSTSPQTTPTASPTPVTTIPPECLDRQDLTEETLCAQHQETILHITKNFGGHSVTFVRAYADVSRFLLVYTTTDSPQSEAISFTSVTIQPGIKLSGGQLVAYEDPSTLQWYDVVSFGTGAVPAGITTLHVESIVDAFSGQSTPLQFTTPFHNQAFDATQKTVQINQAVTSNGITLTLERVAFSIGGTTFHFKSSQVLPMTLYLKSLTIDGKQVASFANFINTRDALVVPIDVPLANRSGAWTLQMMMGIQNNQTDWASWTYHFTMSGK